MSVPVINLDGATQVTGPNTAFAATDTADDRAAKLLLREVQAMLLQGQPRQAIAHICAATGVERDAASCFVAELQTGVFQLRR
jgi:hypothetical protein